MQAFPKRVLLAGATGYLGRAVARELVSRGCDVVALVRQPEVKVHGCSVVPADLTDAEKLAATLDGFKADAIVSCMASRSGAPKDAWLVDHQANSNVLALAGSLGATHFQLLSAICVQRPRLAFQQAKLAFEAELQESGIDHTIIRPTAFFKSLSGQVGRVLKGKPFMVFGTGNETACKPIGEADLAVFMADCLSDPEARNRILPIGGPGDAVTLREAGELLFELAGKPPRFKSVPVGMFRVAEAVLAPLGWVFPGLAAKAEFARIGHYYATESMLVWDAARGCYDAEATPATGSETLRDHYTRVLREGLHGQELGDHTLFD
ncbi:MAG: NAD(P)H-binding protein [Pseudomonadota bacterium]